jgi:GNAT superfamily N-acetyltransferase
MVQGVDFQLVRDPSSPEMDRLLTVYEQGIPISERKPEGDIRAMALSPLHRVEVAAMEGTILGFTLAYVGEGVSLLEYMAVAEDTRGQGLGAILFRRLRDGIGPPLLVEVESDAEDSPDLETRRRRIQFYLRLGCRRLQGVNFVLPLESAHQAPQIELLIAQWQTQNVSSTLLTDWLREIYVGVYGCPTDDPRLLRTVRGLPTVVKATD